MKKKIIIISFIFCLIISLFIITNTKKDKSFIVDGIKYSTKLNGSYVSSFPTKGNYEVTVECENAKGRWNYTKWVAEISNISGYPSCNISFTSTTATNFNDYIISLSGTTQGTGQVVNENGYRYEGKNPNNYVYFNNELWRIIGVFDSTSHGVSNTNLVKIIRNESIGGYAWHKSNINDWPNSSLYHLLNDYYYTATDGTSSSYCYQYSDTVTGNCDYTQIGLQTDYRNMVQTNTIWYLGGPSSVFNPTSTFYANERDSSKIYSGRSASTPGNVGLMYASDYGYSVLSSSCDRTINLNSYSTNACAGNAWLKKETSEWTITPRSGNSSGVWYVYHTGYVSYSNENYGYASRPVLYLKSNVVKYAGDGSISNPYRIRLKNTSKLPTEYQEVEYISSTGTQYIKTNISCNYNDTVKMVSIGNFNLTNNTAWQGVNAYLQHNISSSKVSDGSSSLSLSNNEEITVSYDGNTHVETVTVGSSSEQISRTWNDSSYGGNVTFLKMGDKDSIYSASGVSAYLKGGKIYVDNILKVDLIPAVRKSDNVAGMYDVINNIFYTNNGSGTFGVGNNVN